MNTIHKKIVRDEVLNPVAVEIDYSDWLEIEKILKREKPLNKVAHLSRYVGTLKLTEDPLDYQFRIRS